MHGKVDGPHKPYHTRPLWMQISVSQKHFFANMFNTSSVLFIRRQNVHSYLQPLMIQLASYINNLCPLTSTNISWYKRLNVSGSNYWPICVSESAFSTFWILCLLTKVDFKPTVYCQHFVDQIVSWTSEPKLLVILFFFSIFKILCVI